MAENEHNAFIQEVLGAVYDTEQMTLAQFRSLPQDTQGRLLARFFGALEAAGEQVAGPIRDMIRHGQYDTLATAFNSYLQKRHDELVQQYGRGDHPDSYSVHGETVTGADMAQAQGENAVRLLQALGVIDPGL